MDGAVAQLGERLNGIQKVAGSTPVSSTAKPDTNDGRLGVIKHRWNL